MSEQGTERGHHHHGEGYGQQGYPQPGYGAPQPGYGAPQPGYGAPQPGYGPPQTQFGQPYPQPGQFEQQQYGAPQPGYAAPQPGYGAPQPGYGYAGAAPAYGAPAPGYGPAYGNQQPYNYTQVQGYGWTQQFQGNINWDAARAAFEKVDANHSGSVDWAELRHALSGIGYAHDEETVRILMSMYDLDHSGSLDMNEFTQLTGYLSQTGENFNKHSNLAGQPAGSMTPNQVFDALNAQHGGFLNRIGGSTFVQSLIVFFDKHRTGFIVLGVFLAIAAFIGVLRVLHERNKLPAENFADPAQHQSIIQKLIGFVHGSNREIVA